MFKKFGGLRTHHQLTFAVIVSVALISVWRGVWGLLDIYLLPGNYELSLWVSLLAGLLVLVVSGYAVKELI